MAKLTAEIDRTEVEATTASFEKLRQTIEAVNTELEKLGQTAHGGITIKAVCSLVHVEVAPPKSTASDAAFEAIRQRRG